MSDGVREGEETILPDLEDSSYVVVVGGGGGDVVVVWLGIYKRFVNIIHTLSITVTQTSPTNTQNNTQEY